MTYTKGNVVVENIKIGDIHWEYEFDFGLNYGIKVEVITLPVQGEGETWTWQSKKISGEEQGHIIKYAVTPGFSHYGPNLYDNEAYTGVKYI